MTATDQLCDWIVGAAKQRLAPSARHAAARVLLDASGVMLGASGLSRDIEPFLSLARGGGGGPCTVLGTDMNATAPVAALVNGAMAHALDFEDAFDAAPGHPNASLVPALIALSQAEGPVAGDRFLSALASGCEVSCRMALALRQPMEVGGWYPPPMLAAFGAAAGAASLLGLDAAQVKSALSLMLCQTVMPGEIKHSRQTTIRAIREGFPAQAAVQAALLARAGLTGFEDPLEGKAGFYALYAASEYDPACLADGLGARLCIEELTFKPWPSCRGTHPFIEMALDLRARHGIDPAQVSRVVVEIDAVQRMLAEPIARKRAPAVLIDAKFSIPFCTALALVRGRVDLDSFDDASLTDRAVLDMAARIEPVAVEAPHRTRGSGGAMVLHLSDGRALSVQVGNARGCPAKPLSDAELVAKFIDCAGRAAQPLGSVEAGELARRIMALEDCADVGALFAIRTAR